MQEFTGREYLYIDIANHYGLDKKSWSSRINWVLSHYDTLENHLAEAEEPAEYFAAVQALREIDEGNPIGYPISLDATSSGIQLISILVGDKNAAIHSNVINSGTREDIYTYLYNKMLARLGQEAKIKRDDVKKAIMTCCYGSEATPKKIFGEGTKLLQTFYDVCFEEMPYVMDFMQFCLESWNPNTDEQTWIMPDGFTVHVKIKAPVYEDFNWLGEPMKLVRYVQKPVKKGRNIGANTIHSKPI